VLALPPAATSTCMLPVLSRLRRSASGFINRCRCESDVTARICSLLNSPVSSLMIGSGVTGGAGGGLLQDFVVAAAAVAESSASSECLPHTNAQLWH